MVSGREVLREIESWLAPIKDELDKCSKALDAANRNRENLELEELETLCALARVRLELTPTDVGDACDAAVRRLRAELAAQEKERQSLRANLAHTLGEHERLGPERARLTLRRDAALEALGECGRRVRTLIFGNTELCSSRDRMKDLVSKAAQAATKAAQASKDRDAKGRAYEADRLFRYLWHRGFATPEYDAPNLVRTLDGWVARHVGYDVARRNYELLLEIPTRLEQHAGSLRDQAAATRQALRRDVMAVFAEQGVPALVRAVEAARARLVQVDGQLDGLDEQRGQLERSLAELTASRDARAEATVETAARELRLLQSDDLMAAARATASPHDDDLVAGLSAIRLRAKQAADEVQRRGEDRTRAALPVQHGREIVRRFREHGLELRDFTFSQAVEARRLNVMVTPPRDDLEAAWSWLIEHVTRRWSDSTWIGGPPSNGGDWMDFPGAFSGGGHSDSGSHGGGFGLDDFIGGVFGDGGFDTGGSF